MFYVVLFSAPEQRLCFVDLSFPSTSVVVLGWRCGVHKPVKSFEQLFQVKDENPFAVSEMFVCEPINKQITLLSHRLSNKKTYI